MTYVCLDPQHRAPANTHHKIIHPRLHPDLTLNLMPLMKIRIVLYQETSSDLESQVTAVLEEILLTSRVQSVVVSSHG